MAQRCHPTAGHRIMMLKTDAAPHFTRNALSGRIDVDRIARSQFSYSGATEHTGGHIVSSLRVFNRWILVAKLIDEARLPCNLHALRRSSDGVVVHRDVELWLVWISAHRGVGN